MEVLGHDRINVVDDFFDLGGDSLRAAELFARIETEYGVRLPLSSLFPDSTIERQARLLSQSRDTNRSSLVAVQPAGRGAPFLCVHALDGDVLRFEPLARRLGTDRPFYALRARGLNDGSAPPRSIEEIASGYVEDVLRAG